MSRALPRDGCCQPSARFWLVDPSSRHPSFGRALAPERAGLPSQVALSSAAREMPTSACRCTGPRGSIGCCPFPTPEQTWRPVRVMRAARVTASTRTRAGNAVAATSAGRHCSRRPKQEIGRRCGVDGAPRRCSRGLSLNHPFVCSFRRTWRSSSSRPLSPEPVGCS